MIGKPTGNFGKCSGCGIRVEGQTSTLKNKPEVFRCGDCMILSLAKFCEEVEEGDSISDISRGEQNGAFFRDMLPINKRNL